MLVMMEDVRLKIERDVKPAFDWLLNYQIMNDDILTHR